MRLVNIIAIKVSKNNSTVRFVLFKSLEISPYDKRQAILQPSKSDHKYLNDISFNQWEIAKAGRLVLSISSQRE